ncbi:hypothetical protein HJC23_008352 [Cyclotella cryptica]|uniref:Uncharacterized protein n=1 Tax=Cyclotella cryptica TaxID=29204 RepID=A0ABD3Q4K1_9STRA
MTSTQFGTLPNQREWHRTSKSSPQQLKSCLRKSRINVDASMHSTQVSTASRTASTALSSPLHCQPFHHSSTVRLPAHAVLESPMRPRSEAVVQNNQDDSERQFMRISNYLVAEYNKGNCRTPADAKRLLHRYLPSYQQLREYHNSLSRNFSVLPMFPEPGEHVSFSMTRCIQRVFGPILTSEVNGYDSSISHPASLEKSAQSVIFQPMPIESATLQMARDRNAMATTIIDQPPPVDMVDERLFPPPPIQRENNLPTNRHYPTSPNVNASTVTPHASNGSTFRSTRLTIQTAPPSNNYSLSSTPLFDIASPAPQTYAESSPAGRQIDNHTSSPPTDSLTQESTSYLPADSPPPQPLPFFNRSPTSKHNVSTTITRGLKSASHESFSQSTLGGATVMTKTEDPDDTNNKSCHTANNDVTDKSDDKQSGGKGTPKTSSSSMYTHYQRLSSKDMLPPIIPREDILYYPMSATQPSSPCCFSSTSPSQRRRRRPPTYLQLYIKCERSEPFVQPDSEMDIMTWYRNGENHVTADRTLVVRGTTSLFELIRAITFCFGLSDSRYVGPVHQSGGTTELLSSLGCYNSVCFVSDVKTSSCPETSRTQLTPLPIPGFYYKYVPRRLHEDAVAKGTTDSTEKNGSSVLSNDPVGLQRTCIAQLLDTPLFSGTIQRMTHPPAGRTRLALVYCTPKRQAYLSSRTQRGILPETIYHFQIMLEGIVDEDDLPSSFQTQIPVRCVGGTGGVHGGNVIDTSEEVKELNRHLWGDRDVIGLVSPSADPEKNCEKIIGILGTPLFDPDGHQAYKENVVDRCLYHICSGRLSMTLAEKTQGTVNAVNGTTDWLARQVEQFAKSVSRKANSCLDDDLLCVGNEYDQKLEALVTKVML